MTTFRTASPPQPPDDWLDRLRDHAQLRNLCNVGDTLAIGDETPVAKRLFDFLGTDPDLRLRWDEFNRARPRL